MSPRPSERRPRVLQVCAVDFTAYHLLGGLLRGIRDHGWTAEFACADGQWAARLREDGFTYRRVEMTRAASPVRQAHAIFELARSLAADPPDLVHTHTPVGGIVGRVGAAIAFRGPVVHTFHGLPFEDRPRGLKEQAYLLAERAVARRTDRFFSQARGDVARAARLGIGDPARTTVIGNGVDVGRFVPDPARRLAVRLELGIPADAIVVTLVARLVREKGILELADAALSLRADQRLYYLLVGEALESDRTSVAAELDHHPVRGALGTRWQPLGLRHDVERLLAGSDIFALPSYREGLPRSIIEAMAVGLPVVATNVPACAELVRPGETGLLVSVRDAHELAEALLSLAADEPRRAQMGAHARAIALAEHDESTIVRMQLDALGSLLRI